MDVWLKKYKPLMMEGTSESGTVDKKVVDNRTSGINSGGGSEEVTVIGGRKRMKIR